MARLTIHEQIMRGFERLGYKQDRERWAMTSRYEVFTDHLHPGYRIYVGKLGAVRSGKNVRDSIPLNGLKARALAAGCPKVTKNELGEK